MSKISVITVNLNHKTGLIKTMQSVFDQSYPNVEYIIVDGGSKDDSIDYITSFEDKIAFWSSEKDQGIYDAMNKGWQKATGDYCIFLNSGDYFNNADTLSEVAEQLDGNSIVFGDIIREKDNERTLDVHPEEYSLFTLHHKNLPHQGCFIKTDLLKKLGGYDIECKVLADWVFYNRAVIEENIKIKKVKTIISIFEQGGISTTKNSDEEGKYAVRKHFPFMEDIYNTFQKLRYYELSRPHQALESVLKKIKK